jgi:superfamily II DNA or RNA helicase
VLQLRPYQTDAVTAIQKDWQDGVKDTLVVMATGGGKTQVGLKALTDTIARGGRAVFLAHREELIAQPVERIDQFFPEWTLKTGIVKAEKNETDRAITVACVPSLAQDERLFELLTYGKIDVLVTDEAHHSSASQYQKIYTALKMANPDLKHLGMTATPLRTDGDGLKRTYQHVAAKYGIKELIKLGYLVPLKSLGVQTGVSLKDVKLTTDGDFNEKQLANAYDVDNVWDIVVATHLQYADGRLAMAFTVSVASAYRLAAKFNEAGIPAAAVDGTTPTKERKQILADFRAGKYRVLCNCNVLTEGVDIPETSCIHWVKPTHSDLVYTQGIGRGLRIFPAKTDCLVLDYVPVEDRNIVMAGDLLGKPRAQKDLEAKAEKAGVIISGFSFTGEGNGIDGDPDDIVTRELDYLSISPFQWFNDGKLTTLGLGDDVNGNSRTLAIMKGKTDVYGLVQITRPKGVYTSHLSVLHTSEQYDAVVAFAADYAEQHSTATLTAKNRAWQKLARTDKQADLLRKMRPDMNGEILKLNRGGAAKVLTSEFAKIALRQRGWI